MSLNSLERLENFLGDTTECTAASTGNTEGNDLDLKSSWSGLSYAKQSYIIQ